MDFFESFFFSFLYFKHRLKHVYVVECALPTNRIDGKKKRKREVEVKKKKKNRIKKSRYDEWLDTISCQIDVYCDMMILNSEIFFPTKTKAERWNEQKNYFNLYMVLLCPSLFHCHAKQFYLLSALNRFNNNNHHHNN